MPVPVEDGYRDEDDHDGDGREMQISCSNDDRLVDRLHCLLDGLLVLPALHDRLGVRRDHGVLVQAFFVRAASGFESVEKEGRRCSSG